MVDFSDEKFLLDEIRKGNNQAFEYLFKAYYPRLRGYAIRFVEDEETVRGEKRCVSKFGRSENI